MRLNHLVLFFVFVVNVGIIQAQQITVAGQPGQLDIRKIGEHSIRVTLKPVSFNENFPYTPAVVDQTYPAPVISLRSVTGTVKKVVGNLNVTVSSSPLSVIVTNKLNQPIQHITFDEDGKMSFVLNDQPVLGMGEGGPRPASGTNWRELPIQFDRKGAYDNMQPRWQSDAYGSRNPVALLVGTSGWAIFVATPWVEVDLQKKDRGYFVPWKPVPGSDTPQTHGNQQQNKGKGVHPTNKIVPGLYDFFVFDAHHPEAFMKDFSVISGPAALPPKWALGYMQSHRTLEDDKQMTGIVDSFRIKKIPVDAVIYLGTGFTPRGWNKNQPSFDFNPEVFKRDPTEVIDYMHSKNVKFVVHMVPWDRDKLPSLQGSIPAKAGETVDASHLQNYWQEHVPLVKTGVDAFWPDEGDWFNLFERINRHQLYYQGHLSTTPNVRPWSLHRNGFPGIAQWGGWVWSGDTESSWKTLEGQIAVGINYSLSIAPFWGSDIGGFYPNAELTGELYTRWFQFASFNASFRAHGRAWWTRLPWGWGQSKLGPLEGNRYPLESELNNPKIEPIIKKYDELHYQLMPYEYTLAWEARNTGLPLMRAMWLHYPEDNYATSLGNQYLWGRDILVAPIYEKGITIRKIYLPKGDWYDWWTNEKMAGAQTISKNVDLEIMPLYVRAGAIIPVDPIRQYMSEPVSEPTTLKVYSGNDGKYTLYEDDGISQEYLKKKGSWTGITWNDKTKQLTLSPNAPQGLINQIKSKTFKVELIPGHETKTIQYSGKPVSIKF